MSVKCQFVRSALSTIAAPMATPTHTFRVWGMKDGQQVQWFFTTHRAAWMAVQMLRRHGWQSDWTNKYNA